MSTLIQQFKLSNEEIVTFIDDLTPFMKKMHIERKNILKLSLALEEILLRWQKHFSSESIVCITIKKRLGILSISISLKGEQYNPFDVDENESESNIPLLSKLQLGPVFTYKKGNNIITFKLSKQRQNSVIILMGSIVLGVILGLLGLKFFPVVSKDILDQFLVPVRTTVFNLLTAVAVPLLFFSIFQGIISIDDIASFGKVGKKVMFRFIIKIAVYTAIAGAIMLPIFSINPFGDNNVTGFGGAIQMILDIFPKNIISPFIEGNALQVIVISIVLGLAVLLLGSGAEGIKSLTNQINSALHIIMEWVSKLIPALVFVLILETVWAGNVSNLIGLWKPIVVIAALCLFMIVCEIIIVSIKFKVSPILLIKKIFPSNLIAFGTSCAMASYSVTSDTCEKDLGINKKLTKFSLPVGLVTYMPAISVYYLMILFYGLEQYNLGCSIQWLVIAWLTVTLLSIATPPVSGGSMACFAILLSQMSIPSEAIAFALAINIIAERFCTVANLSMLEMELIHTANKSNLLDEDTLKTLNDNS